MAKIGKDFDLEDRLIAFADRIIQVAESLPNTAESRGDFIHTMIVSLMELRETKVWLLMIGKAHLIEPVTKLEPLIDENNQLISIVVTRVTTAKHNKSHSS